MYFKDLKDKTVDELNGLLTGLRKSVQELTIKARKGELKTNHEIGRNRKTIARILTILSQKTK